MTSDFAADLTVVVPVGAAHEASAAARTVHSVIAYGNARWSVLVVDGVPGSSSADILGAACRECSAGGIRATRHRASDRTAESSNLQHLVAVGLVTAIATQPARSYLVLAPGASLTGTGLAEEANTAFDHQPDVGLLGAFHLGPDSRLRDKNTVAALMTQTAGLRGLRRPRLAAWLTTAERRAQQVGYDRGDHLRSEAWLIRHECATAVLTNRGWRVVGLERTGLEAAQLVGLMAAAAGWRTGEFAAGAGPLGSCPDVTLAVPRQVAARDGVTWRTTLVDFGSADQPGHVDQRRGAEAEAAAAQDRPLPEISVVITTHQRLPRLKRLVNALLIDPAAAEIVVVADNCSDGTDEWLTSFAAANPRVLPLLLHPNVGQPRARATGIAQASNEIVLSLDDDVVPAPGLATGHALAYADGTVDLVAGYMPTIVSAHRKRNDFATREYQQSYETHVAWWEDDPDCILQKFWAGNFSVRKQVYLDAVAGYDFRLKYHEDAELGLRMHALGARARFGRTLVAKHEHRRSWEQYLGEGSASVTGRLLMTERHPGERDHFATDDMLNDASVFTKMVVAAAVRPMGGVAVRSLLKAGGAAAGRTGLHRTEERLARTAKIIVVRQAVSQQQRRALHDSRA